MADNPRAPFPKITGNKIEYIWHAVGAVGNPSSGYEFSNNEVITVPIPNSWYSQGMHAIDMHPDGDIRYGRGHYIGCESIKVFNNTFIDNFSSAGHPKVKIVEDIGVRGVPIGMVLFYNNVSYNSAETSVIYEYESWKGNTWVYDNRYQGQLVDMGTQNNCPNQI